MADLTPEIVDDVVAACKSAAAEIGEAFGRALDARIAASVAGHRTFDSSVLPVEFSGPGLAVVLTVGSAGAIVLLPEKGGLVPAWCADPDPTGQSKLTTLAQELGMTLLPEQFMPEDFRTGHVRSLAGAVGRGAVADGAACVSLTLAAAGKQDTAWLIWPVPKPAAVVGQAKSKPEPKAASEGKGQPAAASQPAANTPAQGKGSSARQPSAPAKQPNVRIGDLPNYARSLLRIKVPVVVTLAEKRQPLDRIIELGPGLIIQFEKSCEEMLDLAVGDCRVATGEAVKVGDKFGLRITSMVLPEERFRPVPPKQKT